MKEEQKKLQENVVLFPGVVEKLVGKGMDALKEKQFKAALSFFEHALEINPDHSQGRFGVALSLIEQGRLDEAKDVTEKMLREDIGNYYDILQVHISLLVQLGHYNEVVTMLEGIIGEEKLPANLAESFYHLLHFSRQMVNDHSPIETEDIHTPSEDLLHMLNEGPPQKQWLAIQMLSKMSSNIFLDNVKSFLKKDKNDPVLKSFILQLLKEKEIGGNIEIHKFGKVMNINVSDLENVFHEQFGNNTLTLVANHLESDNPSLLEVIKQIWWHYLFALYPIAPEPFDSHVWAAAIHKIGEEMFGLDNDELLLARQYNVNVEELLRSSEKIMKIEQETFKE